MRYAEQSCPAFVTRPVLPGKGSVPPAACITPHHIAIHLLPGVRAVGPAWLGHRATTRQPTVCIHTMCLLCAGFATVTLMSQVPASSQSWDHPSESHNIPKHGNKLSQASLNAVSCLSQKLGYVTTLGLPVAVMQWTRRCKPQIDQMQNYARETGDDSRKQLTDTMPLAIPSGVVYGPKLV